MTTKRQYRHAPQTQTYRALISVPISATDDEEARNIADAHAASLYHPNSTCIAGHTEYVMAENGRMVHEDPNFRRLHGLGGTTDVA